MRDDDCCVDYVVSHTCPFKFMPADLLLRTEQMGQ